MRTLAIALPCLVAALSFGRLAAQDRSPEGIPTWSTSKVLEAQVAWDARHERPGTQGVGRLLEATRRYEGSRQQAQAPRRPSLRARMLRRMYASLEATLALAALSPMAALIAPRPHFQGFDAPRPPRHDGLGAPPIHGQRPPMGQRPPTGHRPQHLQAAPAADAYLAVASPRPGRING